EQTIDWLLHINAELDDAGTEPAPEALAGPCGYDQLVDIRRILGRPSWLTFRLGFRDLTVDLGKGVEDEELYVATAPGNPAADTHSLLVRRCRGTSATFVTRLEIG